MGKTIEHFRIVSKGKDANIALDKLLCSCYDSGP